MPGVASRHSGLGRAEVTSGDGPLGGRYNAAFYRSQVDASGASARAAVPIILDVLRPSSVVDVGCGTGVWLAEFAARGCVIHGLEGGAPAEELRVPREAVRWVDLSDIAAAPPGVRDLRADLCLSLEVAEHLPAAAARQFVSYLCSVSDVVLLSAAIPRQGGNGHVNEQWPEYWAALFAACDFGVSDALRRRLWDEPGVEVFYRQNLLTFVRGGDATAPVRRRLDELAARCPPPIRVVHPDLWTYKMSFYRDPRKLARSAIGKASGAARRGIYAGRKLLLERRR